MGAASPLPPQAQRVSVKKSTLRLPSQKNFKSRPGPHLDSAPPEQSHGDTSSRTFSNSIQADIPPNSCVCGKEEVSTLAYDSTFTVDVCVTGAFRCQYSPPCNGHYYWYVPLTH